MGATLAAIITLLSAVEALNAGREFPGAMTGPGYVHLPIVRQDSQGAGALQRRAGSETSDLTNAQNGGYMINITLGSPGQNTMVVLDSGSIELWVNPNCDNANKANDPKIVSNTNGVDNADNDPDYCKKIGRYDHTKSSTAKTPGLNDTTFQYADFTSADITYYQDTLGIAGVTVTDQIFGVATQSNQSATGILGIGPDPFGFNKTPEYPYSLMLSNMAHQGLIQSRAFSLDLRDYDNTTGSLIFGGVDKSKFTGSLTPLKFATVDFKYSDGSTVTDYSYWLTVDSMSLTPAGSTTSSKSYDLPGGNFIADLDTGTGAILVPSGLTAKLCSDLNGTTTGRNCVVDCSYRQKTGGLSFGFDGGKTILVSYENLLQPVEESGTEFCFLQVSDSTITTSPATYILGAPFLRSSYAVFDWDNQNVHLAQAANCGSPNIVAIGSGANAVPTDGGCSSPASHAVVNHVSLLVTVVVLGLLVVM